MSLPVFKTGAPVSEPVGEFDSLRLRGARHTNSGWPGHPLWVSARGRKGHRRCEHRVVHGVRTGRLLDRPPRRRAGSRGADARAWDRRKSPVFTSSACSSSTQHHLRCSSASEEMPSTSLSPSSLGRRSRWIPGSRRRSAASGSASRGSGRAGPPPTRAVETKINRSVDVPVSSLGHAGPLRPRHLGGKLWTVEH